MPGKINRTPCAALTVAPVQVLGNDHAVAFVGSRGIYRLNLYKPVTRHNVRRSNCWPRRRLPGAYGTEPILFHECFPSKNGRGLGASHQTGWMALITGLLEMAPCRRHP
jgi:hypothetical protein